MFYVQLKRNGSEVLGNCEGQGFYRYKQLWRVKKIIMEYHYKKHGNIYRDGDKLSWEIYQISENEMYKNFEKYKKPVCVISE